MFSQDDEKRYVDRFFTEKPNPSISWLHDIGKTRFGAASSALLSEAQGAVNLESKHVSTFEKGFWFWTDLVSRSLC